jgi:putative ABC transport system permease protein
MRNYLVVLLRNLQREKLYAAINIAGLSLGIACCLILGLFLRSELTYDRHHVKHDRIYRIVNEFTTGGTTDRFAVTSRVLGPMLAADYPEVKAHVRFQKNGNNDGGTAIRHGDDVYYWENTYFVDDNVFDVFTHDIIYGDPKTALKEGGALAVSQTFARKYFGDANPSANPSAPTPSLRRRSPWCSPICRRTHTSSTTCCSRAICRFCAMRITRRCADSSSGASACLPTC